MKAKANIDVYDHDGGVLNLSVLLEPENDLEEKFLKAFKDCEFSKPGYTSDQTTKIRSVLVVGTRNFYAPRTIKGGGDD